MPISFVGSVSAQTTTFTLPTGMKAGDLIIVFSFQDGNTINPTIPAGWTNITNTYDGTTCAISMGWKLASGSSDVSGDWSGSINNHAHVYRGTRSDGSPVGVVVGSNGTTSPSTYGAVNLANDCTSWLVAFQGHRSVDTTTMDTAPTGMTNREYFTGVSSDSASFDTNGPYTTTTSYASNTVAPGGTQSGWITAVLEIYGPTFLANNYQHARSISAGIISLGEKIR